MEAGAIPWYLNWYLPDWAPFVEYTIKELVRWVADNLVPLTILTNVLTYLKILAIRNGRVKDDKILTWLLGFITFKWISRITSPIPPEVPAGTKANPIVLTEVVDQKEWKEKNTEEILK
jgi:hypothetical protein